MYGSFPKVTIIQNEQPVMVMTPQDMSEATPLLSEVSYQRHRFKKRSAIVYLFLAQILFVMGFIEFSYRNDILSLKESLALLTVPLGQIVWAGGIIHLGAKYQYFARDTFLRAFPILWLPLVPLVLQQLIFQLTLPPETLDNVLESISTGIIVLQGLRVLAVGSLIKWNMGLFPTAFAWGTAFPDMLYGCSAWWILYMQHATSNATTHDNNDATTHLFFTRQPVFLLTWHLIGFALLVPFGITIVQLGMAPTALYRSAQPYRLVFEYPMVLGPALAVPIFLSWNLLMVMHEYGTITALQD